MRKLLRGHGFFGELNPVPDLDANQFGFAMSHSVGSRHV